MTREATIKPPNIQKINVLPESQEHPMVKGQSLQQMVLGKLGKYMQNNEI